MSAVQPATEIVKGSFRESLARFWRIRGLNALLNASMRYAPSGIRSYVEEERLRTRVRNRRRAVNETAFRELLRRGILELGDRTGLDTLGDYLEFGVYNGSSLVATFRETAALGLPDMRLFGFDSFEGLPAAAAHDDGGLWEPGAWRSDLEFTLAVLAAEGVDQTRVTLIPGWFRETCRQETARRFGITKASVIMVDCDIYSSTKEALAFCTPLIDDHALVLFDDWHSGQLAAKNMGERRAFEEWMNDSGCFSCEPFGSYNRKSEVFIVSRRGSPNDPRPRL